MSTQDNETNSEISNASTYNKRKRDDEDEETSIAREKKCRRDFARMLFPHTLTFICEENLFFPKDKEEIALNIAKDQLDPKLEGKEKIEAAWNIAKDEIGYDARRMDKRITYAASDAHHATEDKFEDLFDKLIKVKAISIAAGETNFALHTEVDKIIKEMKDKFASDYDEYCTEKKKDKENFTLKKYLSTNRSSCIKLVKEWKAN